MAGPRLGDRASPINTDTERSSVIDVGIGLEKDPGGNVPVGTQLVSLTHRYSMFDHLGSPTKTFDELSQSFEQFGFDSWRARRDGGSCRGGALSDGFSALAGYVPVLNNTGLSGRVVVGAIASKLGGGRAEHGALTAAFDYLFNQVLHAASAAARGGAGGMAPAISTGDSISSEASAALGQDALDSPGISTSINELTSKIQSLIFSGVFNYFTSFRWSSEVSTLMGGNDGAKKSGQASEPTAAAGGAGMPPDDDEQKPKHKRPNAQLERGDSVDLSKFNNRVKVEGQTRMQDPKSGYSISADRAGTNSHGGSAWKLLDRAGNRVATLDVNGVVLRK
jgi:hypothetical protein